MKLIYSSREYAKHFPRDKSLTEAFDDGNYSAIFSGMSGSGKDTVCMAMLDLDMKEGRTPIILDVKMEYPSTVFLQNDTVLSNILRKNKRVPRAYKTNLWIPYIKGLEKNKHFRELLKHHHPNLKIRPFRILTPDLISEDTKNFALGKSFLQAMNPGENKGASGMYNLIREKIGQIKLCFDDTPLEIVGWEYINFEEITTNREVNVFSFFFMLGQNNISAISFAISILNEILTIAKGTNRPRDHTEVFSIYIPEVQIILPKRVKSLEDVVNVLHFSMLVGLLLMRSFYARIRMNLQNLSALPPDMFSQSRMFAGKTSNPKDFTIFGTFGFGRQTRKTFRTLPKGAFIDLLKKRPIGILVPQSHKSRERESFLSLLQAYQKDPTSFLYETRNCYLSELDESVVGHFPMSVEVYRKRVKRWLKNQPEHIIKPLNIPDPLAKETSQPSLQQEEISLEQGVNNYH